MTRALALMLALLPLSVFAQNNACLSEKYHGYVDASINWYEDLVKLTVEKDATLEDVSQWFLEGRKNHFEFNKEAFDYYLENDPGRLKLDTSVEGWLNLSQDDIKTLSQTEGPLSEKAAEVFNFRQSTPHARNYDMRSALADILSHPDAIQEALNRYNTAVLDVSNTECK
ncbi:hypothetical protein NF212_07825 [Parasalinivibrio latis]|uniref:hypothetical protein n=1 Tax=Parasalinivibrio latis TaxID=2952610 RepID=UPI0030E3C4F7